MGLAVAFAFAGAAMLEGRLDRLGALDTAVDDSRLGVSDVRHRARQLVGVLRARVGRLLVLGSGGERLLHAVARGTALVHSLAVTEKRGLFKSWTLLLAILAFSLSLVGTFLVRSGVLVSVHSFAAGPDARHASFWRSSS